MFERQAANVWQLEVPGARWFKADLHVHTINAHPGQRAKLPAGLTGEPADLDVRAQYARRFLQAVVKSGVQVVGLASRSSRSGRDAALSTVWRILEEWNEGNDDDGIPFRHKIYALFPGFESSLRNGSGDFRLLCLFDPEIGRARFLTAFDLVMGGVTPWKAGVLQVSTPNADETFQELEEFFKSCRVCDEDCHPMWSSLVLAPHIDALNGSLGVEKDQILKLFTHGQITGLELDGNTLPEDALRNHSWLEPAMSIARQAFFHSSDTCELDGIGRRHIWVKLASPHVEALR